MAFESVARHGSFSRAADELSITQSAVSHRISQLESLVGASLLIRCASLLIRIGHSVSLAPAGKELLPYVREGLGCLRAGLAKISTEGKPILKLSLAPAIASNWLIQRLSAFHRKHPDINLEINVSSRNINLRTGEADVAIRCGEGRWDGLDAIELIPLKEIAVCSPAYKKAHPWLRCLEDRCDVSKTWSAPPSCATPSFPGSAGSPAWAWNCARPPPACRSVRSHC